MTISPELLQAL